MFDVSVVSDIVASFTNFMGWFIATLAILQLFAIAFSYITPYSESAAIADKRPERLVPLLGGVVGMTIILLTAQAQASSFVDFAVWAALGAFAQFTVLVYLGRYIFASSTKDGETSYVIDRLAFGVMYAIITVCVACLNAVSMIV